MNNATPANRPIHVVHLIESLGAGGAERLLHTNLRHLDRLRFHNTVLTVFSEPDHWVEPIRRLGVTVESLECHSLRDFPVGIARLRRWLRANQPDLLHSHLWAANVIGRVAGRMAGVPVISSVHNPDHEPEAWEDGADVSLWKRRLALSLDRWSARFGSERLIAVSEYVRQCAGRRLQFPMERIDLLYNPIDPDALQRAERGPEELRRACGIAPESLVLLNVGRVSPQKGLLYAVRALPEIIRQHPQTHLVSVGSLSDTRWVEHLKDEARSLSVSGHVHFMGPQREVGKFLFGSDLFIFPSLYEGLGIALIEAMVAGCACVATDTGPISEVITHGVDGRLVPPRDAQSLAEAVNALLGDSARREALGKAAEASALARFQPQVAAVKLAAIYDSVLKGEPAKRRAAVS